ncbi:signal peptide protein [Cupriavidus sp. HPC(L)]|nr:signal peptide protein [Cupriavidus sp. HPC(L)]
MSGPTQAMRADRWRRGCRALIPYVVATGAATAPGLLRAQAISEPAAAPPPGAVQPSMQTPTPAPAPVAAPPVNEPVIRTVGAVSYVCGGVGEDEQRRLAARQKQFNMGVLFTQGASGEYLADVEVRLMREGHEVARFRTEGPRCLIKAPEGRYNVHATYNGQPKSMTVGTGTYDAQLRW